MSQLLQSDFWIQLENLPLAWTIGGTWWFPMLESIHVIAAAMVVGSILMVDLRLLGFAAGKYAISTMSRELVPWTWFAFAVATVTGLGMFITRAASHVLNPAFQWKMFLLLLAGINMIFFHYWIYRQIQHWDVSDKVPANIRFFGASSLIIWCGVMLSGRWVGHIV